MQFTKRPSIQLMESTAFDSPECKAVYGGIEVRYNRGFRAYEYRYKGVRQSRDHIVSLLR